MAYEMDMLLVKSWSNSFRGVARAAVEAGWPVTLDQTDGYDLCQQAAKILGDTELGE